jgi:hypothetical protein
MHLEAGIFCNGNCRHYTYCSQLGQLTLILIIDLEKMNGLLIKTSATEQLDQQCYLFVSHELGFKLEQLLLLASSVLNTRLSHLNRLGNNALHSKLKCNQITV